MPSNKSFQPTPLRGAARTPPPLCVTEQPRRDATAVNTKSVRAIAAALAIIAAPAFANPKIAPHAVMPITQNSYPKLYAAWGTAGVKRINELMPKAAQKAAASPECDKVDLVELSQSRSTPGKKIVFFVDCVNTKRFYIEDSELAATAPAQSQTAKMSGMSDSQATLSCESAIKAQVMNPLTFNRKMGTTSVYRAPTTGNVVVQFTFEAKNNLGALVPSKAKCVITDRGIEEASISSN